MHYNALLSHHALKMRFRAQSFLGEKFKNNSQGIDIKRNLI